MPRDRRSKLTPAVSKKLCEAISKGYSIPAACSVVGIVEMTYYNWYNKGKTAKKGKYRQFYIDANNAKDQATYNVESIIIEQLPTNPNDAKWWLIKRRPKIYADRTYNETKVEANVNNEVTVNLLDKIKEKRRELDDIRND